MVGRGWKPWHGMRGRARQKSPHCRRSRRPTQGVPPGRRRTRRQTGSPVAVPSQPTLSRETRASPARGHRLVVQVDGLAHSIHPVQRPLDRSPAATYATHVRHPAFPKALRAGAPRRCTRGFARQPRFVKIRITPFWLRAKPVPPVAWTSIRSMLNGESCTSAQVPTVGVPST